MHSSPTRTPQPLTRKPSLWLFCLFLVHLAFALYYFPPGELLNNAPLAGFDYATHFYDAFTVSSLLSSGHSWGYDPYFMAGYPVGTIFDVDNKLTEAFVFLFAFIGKSIAYNLFVVILYLAVPFIVLATARVLRLGQWACVAAVALGLLVWNFDPSVYNMRYVGMFSFAAVSYTAPFIIAVAFRFVNAPSARVWIVLVIAFSLGFWLNPLIFIPLVLPLLLLYLFNFRTLARTQHLALFALILIVLAINSYWLVTLLEFRGIVTDTAVYLQGGLRVLLNDLLAQGWTEGSRFPRLLALRWSILLASAIGLFLWWGSPRRVLSGVWGSTIVWLVGLAYFGARLPLVPALEPYRFIVPALFFAVFPAASALTSKKIWRALPSLHPAPRFAISILILIALIGIALALNEFRPKVEHLWGFTVPEDRQLGPNESQHALFRWLEKNTTRAGRVVIQDWATAALGSYFVEREYIGGPYFPYFIRNGFVNVGIYTAFDKPIQDFSSERMRAYLDFFNIRWIIINPSLLPTNAYTFSSFFTEHHPDFMSYVTTVGGYEIYRVNVGSSADTAPKAEVTAGLNSLRVHSTGSGSTLLPYHWLDTLKSEPPLKLTPFPALEDPVGFIRVENGDTRDFLIYNGY